MSESSATREYQSRFAPAEQPGELGRLAGYSIRKLLSSGGMGEVYEAEDLALHRPVALKIMLGEIALRPEARARFLREARSAAAVVHDHIVRIYQVGEDRGLLFIAMELLRGESLAERLHRPQPDAAEILRIATEACAGLAAAHEAGLVHRDIKPANLWLEAGTGRVKILDFGLARSNADGTLTNTGQIFGTPAYISPEQASGRPADHRADLFSLGSVLYELATGRRAFRGDNILVMLNSLANETPAPPHELNPGISPGLSHVIMKLIEKDPLDRPASAGEVMTLLNNILANPGSTIGNASIDRHSKMAQPSQLTTFQMHRLIGLLLEADDILQPAESRRIGLVPILMAIVVLCIAIAVAVSQDSTADSIKGFVLIVAIGIVLFAPFLALMAGNKLEEINSKLLKEFPEEAAHLGLRGSMLGTTTQIDKFVLRSLLSHYQQIIDRSQSKIK